MTASKFLTIFLFALVQPFQAVQAAEVVPGLNLFPTNITCCPTLPLVGPTWMIDATSLSTTTLGESTEQCSFFPSWERPMVVVFQPNGIVNGWADHNACHYFHGSYYFGTSSTYTGSPYAFDFQWSRWKSQPYSCPLSDSCGGGNSDINNQLLDSFWERLSSSVTTLIITGYTNVELQDHAGQVIVRLEALQDSYFCDASTSPSHMEEVCDPVLHIPKPLQEQSLTIEGGSIDSNNNINQDLVLGYSPEELAMGGGGAEGSEGHEGHNTPSATDERDQSSNTVPISGASLIVASPGLVIVFIHIASLLSL